MGRPASQMRKMSVRRRVNCKTAPAGRLIIDLGGIPVPAFQKFGEAAARVSKTFGVTMSGKTIIMFVYASDTVQDVKFRLWLRAPAVSVDLLRLSSADGQPMSDGSRQLRDYIQIRHLYENYCMLHLQVARCIYSEFGRCNARCCFKMHPTTAGEARRPCPQSMLGVHAR